MSRSLGRQGSASGNFRDSFFLSKTSPVITAESEAGASLGGSRLQLKDDTGMGWRRVLPRLSMNEGAFMPLRPKPLVT